MWVHELTQAARRNNQKTMDEMQTVTLFSLPHEPGDPRRSMQAGTSTSGGAGTVELGAR